MKILLVSLMTILFFTNLFSQVNTFQKRINWQTNQDGEYSMIKKTENGYLITCSTVGAIGFEDVMLLYTKLNCNLNWTKVYGGYFFDRINDIQQTSDSGFVFIGSTSSFGPSAPNWTSAYLIKTDNIGNIKLSYAYGGSESDVANSILQTNDNGYIFAGGTQSFGVGVSDIFVVKTDSLGNVVWANSYGTIASEGASVILPASYNGYIVIGKVYKDIYNNDGDIFMMKIDSLGSILWSYAYGGTLEDHPYSAKQTSDGGYIISGFTCSFGLGYSDIYLIKTSADGIFQWSKTYGGNGADNGWEVQQTSDGGYIICGTTNSFGAGGIDNYIIKTNSIGDILWTKTYGGPIDEFEGNIVQANEGGYLISSFSSSFSSGFSDLYLIKTDSNGNSGCNEYNTSTLISSPNNIKDTIIFLQITAGVLRDTVINILSQKGETVFTMCSDIVSVNENSKINDNNDVVIFPNPVDNILTIEKENIKKIEIQNFLGVNYKSIILYSNKHEIDMSGIKNGIYVIKIYTDKEIIIRKVIKK
ncbi:MAG: T9SS type A sorting domain-containing protein [Bacteroidia bacterium]|nr:T9SS type A sorting domain-containing protein [Bacteroidia bacterium]